MTNSLESAVTLDDVIQAVGQKRVPLAAELAGYLVLEILTSAPPQGDLDWSRTYLSEEGTVAFVRPKGEKAEGDTEQSARKLLGKLLELGGSKTPALAATAAREGSAKPLAAELEAALIPLNRSAGRRALARVAREVRRITQGIGRNASAATAPRRSSPSFTTEVRDRAPSDPTGEARAPSADVAEPSAAESDAIDALLEDRSTEDVDALLSSFTVSDATTDDKARRLKEVAGVDPTPPPPSADLSVDELLAEVSKRAPPAAAPPKVAAASQEPDPVTSRDASDEIAARLRNARAVSDETGSGTRAAGDARPAPAPSKRDVPSAVGKRREPPSSGMLPAVDEPRPRKKKKGALDRVLLIALLGLLLVAAVLAWNLKPGFLSGRTQDVVDKERAEASARAQILPPKACRTQVALKEIPKDAEVLLRVGAAPVDVPNLQAGTRLEFVATLDGYAPRRTVVTKEAWEKGADGKPRAEAAVQLDKSRARPGASDPWPAGDPGTEIGGKGPPGSVHIVGTPRGAEVWLLMALNAGSNPDAKIELAGCKGDVELLVAGPGPYRKRIPIREADFVAGTDVRSLTVSGR